MAIPTRSTGASWLRSLRISRKLLLLLLPILMLLAGLSAWMGASLWTRYQGPRDTQAVAIRCMTTGGVVHALQAERGLSSGFLSGAPNAEALKAQREKVTQVVQEAGQGAATPSLGALAERLGTLRNKVDARALSAPEAMAEYSREIATLLNGLDLKHGGRTRTISWFSPLDTNSIIKCYPKSIDYTRVD